MPASILIFCSSGISSRLTSRPTHNPVGQAAINTDKWIFSSSTSSGVLQRFTTQVLKTFLKPEKVYFLRNIFDIKEKRHFFSNRGLGNQCARQKFLGCDYLQNPPPPAPQSAPPGEEERRTSSGILKLDPFKPRRRSSATSLELRNVSERRGLEPDLK